MIKNNRNIILPAALSLGMIFGCNENESIPARTHQSSVQQPFPQTQPISRNVYSLSIDALLESPEQYENKPVSVEGTPYACSRTAIHYRYPPYFSLAVYIGSQDKSRGVLGYSETSIDYHTKAEALINGVINSGSNQKIVLRGRFKNSIIELESIHANGCDLSFN